MPNLLPLLRHNDWKIRIAVIHTLEAMDFVGAEVKPLLKDPEKLVRDAAKKALSAEP